MINKNSNSNNVQSFPFKSREALKQYIPHLLTRLSHRWALDQRAALSDSDSALTPTMMRILASLSAHPKLTINQLSALSVSEQSTTSRIVEQLVLLGLVERTSSEADQRIRTVALTPQGETHLQEIAPIVKNLYGNLVANIKTEDLETCVRVLNEMTENICINKL